MTNCKIEQCTRPVRSKGLCGSHYQKSIAKPYVSVAAKDRHTLTEVDYESKTATCAVCGEDTPIYVWPSTGARGCHNKVKKSYTKRKRRPENRKLQWYTYYFADGKKLDNAVVLKARESLMKLQNGVCAVCSRPESEIGTLCLDHCHTTGEIRGLLCRSCNSGIGLLGDTLDGIKAAARYLSKESIQFNDPSSP